MSLGGLICELKLPAVIGLVVGAVWTVAHHAYADAPDYYPALNPALHRRVVEACEKAERDEQALGLIRLDVD